eukprot:CAMPEP_0185832008 /NCGR_PEP_ID=MMETSP1353-20130828/1833_1 /TAXON_ID=1077150 /ORGANISM="Erythrolobus australicus, Strain CCMP3124" /LENGTH=586 /DNA_ID=CAMNT_0028530137 /DNA_START=75 /DNA_END=1835 /DNA_ORIENTATION=-
MGFGEIAEVSLADQFMQDFDAPPEEDDASARARQLDGEALQRGPQNVYERNSEAAARDSETERGGPAERVHAVVARILGLQNETARMVSRGKTAHEGEAGVKRALECPALELELELSVSELVECIELTNGLEQLQSDLHRSLGDVYRKCFPELDALQPTQLQFAHIVHVLGGEPRRSSADTASKKRLNDELPPNLVISLCIAACTTLGSPLDQSEQRACVAGSRTLLEAASTKEQLLRVVASCASRLAPNVVALLSDASLAAALIAAAGSVHQLAAIPACNLQVLGAHRGALLGGSAAQAALHRGIIYDCDLVKRVQDTRAQRKCARVVAAKLALCTRADANFSRASLCSDSEPTRGHMGATLRAEIESKLEAWALPPPMRTVRPLPVPDAGQHQRKRRGGRRARAYKALYGVSQVRAHANRMAFGEAEASYGLGLDADDDEDATGGGGLGMLATGGAARSARSVISASSDGAVKGKRSISKAAQRRLDSEQSKLNRSRQLLEPPRAPGVAAAKNTQLGAMPGPSASVAELAVTFGRELAERTSTREQHDAARAELVASNGARTSYFAAQSPFVGVSLKSSYKPSR